MNTAMYDAVNSIARTHQPYHVDMTAAAGDESRSRRRSGCTPRTERHGSGESGNVRRGAGKQLIQCA